MMHRGVGMWGEIISRDELLNLEVKIGYIMEWNGIVGLGVDTTKLFNVWHIVNIPRYSHAN